MKKLAFVCTGIAHDLKLLPQSKAKVATLLRSCGWQVETARLHSLATLNKSLKEFQDEDVEEFIFYFIGHGVKTNVEATLKLILDEDDKTSINDILESIFDKFTSLPRKQVIIIDACHSGNFHGLDNDYRSVEFLTSSKKEQRSYEDDTLECTLFSHYFCQIVEKTQNPIVLNEIGNKIEQEIRANHNSKYWQTPQYKLDGNHQIFFETPLSQEFQKIDHQHQSTIDLITQKGITLIQLAMLSSEYIQNDKIIEKLNQQTSIEDMVSYLTEQKEFEAIEEAIRQERPIKPPQLSVDEPKPRVIVILRSVATQEVEANFIAIGFRFRANGEDDSKKTYDLNSQEDTSALKAKIASYVEHFEDKEIDLIVDASLMNHNFKSWQLSKKTLIGCGSVNIGASQRYELGKMDGVVEYFEELWRSRVESRYTYSTKSSLFPIDSCQERNRVHPNLEYAGIQSTCKLKSSDFEELFADTLLGVNMVMLWTTDESGANFEEFGESRLEELKEQFTTSDNCAISPLNLMWDDPRRYYYPHKVNV